MANKDKTELDDLDLDDFNLDDAEFSLDPPPDTRSPIRKVAGGFVKGIADDLFSLSNLKRRVVGVLPEGYGRAINLTDEVADTGKELYHTAARELRPARRDFQRGVDRLMPKVEGKVPSAWSDRLKEFAREQDKEESGTATVGGVNEGEITGSLAEIFDAQMHANAQMEQEKTERLTVENKLRDKMASNRSNSLLGQLDGIRQAAYRQVGFQDHVTAKYQRKSLELQYRQFFALRDLVKITGESNKMGLERLGSIVHNTALPEYRKMQLTEAGGQMLRDRMLMSTQQGVLNYASSFLSRTRQSVTDSVTRNVRGFTDAVRGVSDQASMAGDMASDTPGLDRHSLAGSTLGGLAGDKLVGAVSPYIRDRLNGNEKLSKGSDFLSYYVNSMPQLLNQWALNDNGETGFKGSFIRFLKDMLPKYYQDTVAGEAPILEADQVAKFDHLTRRSITEIIPGYLSRIHNELSIIRTGDDSTPRLTYNLDRGEYTTTEVAKQDVMDRIFDKEVIGNSSRVMDEFIADLDPINNLSEKARKELSLQILKDVSGGLPFDPARLGKASYYSSDKLEEDDRQAIANTIRDQFNVVEEFDDLGESKLSYAKDARVTKTAARFNELANSMPDPRQRIMGYRENGNRDLLEQLGLLQRQGSFDYVNYDRVWDTYRRGVAEENVDTTPTGATGGPGVTGLGGFSTRNRGNTSDVPSATANVPPYPPGGGAIGGMGQIDFAELIKSQRGIADQILEAIRNKQSNPNAKMLIDFSELIAFQKQTTDRIVTALSSGVNQGNVTGAGHGLSDVIAAQQQGATRVRDTLKELDLRPQADVQIELLSQILERLNTGGVGDNGSSGGGRLSGAIDRLGTGLGKMWDGVTGFYGGAFSGAGSVVGGAGDFLRGALTGAGDLLSRGRDRVVDLYVQGERHPRLIAAKLRAGEYRDQVTNKVITSMEDLRNLKGPVVDSLGDVILTVEDMELGVVTRQGKFILKRGVGFVTSYYKKAFGLLSAPYRVAFDVLNGTRRKVVGLFNKVVDVYVKGEPTPRLLAMILESGGYFNKTSREPVRKIKDIKEDVVDIGGNIVLSLNDMRKGLVDINGHRLTGAGRLTELAVRALKTPFRMARWGLTKAKGALNVVKGAVTGGLEGLMERFNGFGAGREIAEKQHTILEEIRDILLERLPEPRKWNDTDGDGLREGGWREQQAEREAAAKREAEKDANDGRSATQKGYFTSLGDKLKGLFAAGGGGDDDDGGGDIDIDIESDGRRRRRPRSRLGRAWRFLKDKGGSAARWVGTKGRGALTAARTALPLAATALPSMGAVSAGLGSAASAAGAMGTAALSGIGAAATAVAATVSAPVLLAGAAVAAVGAGAYLAYRWFKSDDEPKPLRDYRIAQYGIDPRNEQDLKKTLFLEDLLLEEVRWSGNTPRIGQMDADRWAELMDGIGISSQSERDRNALETWLQQRFTPVFQKHLSVLRAIDDDMDLEDVDDDLSDRNKREYLAGVGHSTTDTESPYFKMTYPYAAGAAIDITPKQVALYEDIARRTVEAAIAGTEDESAAELTKMREKLKDNFPIKTDRDQGTDPASGETPAEQVQDALVKDALRKQITTKDPVPSPAPTDQKAIGWLEQQRNRAAQAASAGGSVASMAGFTGGETTHPGNGTGGSINDLPNPVGDGSWDVYKELIVQGSKMTGVDPGLMATMAAIESNFRGRVKASTSSATGLYQFISSTWRDMLRKYGDKYGISENTPPTDVRANVLMGAEFLKENMRTLKRVKDGPISDTDVYAAHFMGAGGASTLLKSNPNSVAANIFPAAARANKSIFYSKGMPRTVGGVYEELNRRVATRRDRYATKARTLAQELGTAPVAANDESMETGGQPIITDEAQASAAAIANTPAAPTGEEGKPNTTDNMARALLSQPTPRSTVTAPTFSGSQEVRTLAAPVSNVVSDGLRERRDRKVQEAAIRDTQGQQRNESQAEAMSSLVTILEQSLTTQRSIDSTLQEIRTVLVQNKASRETPETPTPPAPSTARGNRPSVTTTNQAPVDVRRRRG